MTAENPYAQLGSVISYSEERGLDLNSTETLGAYTQDLAQLRRDLAHVAGVRPDSVLQQATE